MAEKPLPSYRSTVDNNFSWDAPSQQAPGTPEVPQVPGQGIPGNAFDNPLEGPTHTGQMPVPPKGK